MSYSHSIMEINCQDQPILHQYLHNVIKNNRIPHAQLLIGDSGKGTLPISLFLAALLLDNNTAKKKIEKEYFFSYNTKKLLDHPDFHVIFPITSTTTKNKKISNKTLLNNWKLFAHKQPYASLNKWYDNLDTNDKEAKIGVEQISNLHKVTQLKSFYGGRKVILIWHVETLNTTAVNKILKLLEEPPSQTFFILVTANEKQLLPTLKSRCQLLELKPIPTTLIGKKLQNDFNVDALNASKIANLSEGNYEKAIYLQKSTAQYKEFESWMVDWVRMAYKAKSNKGVIQPLLSWATQIANCNRLVQKDFLSYILIFFREAFLTNYTKNTDILSSINFEQFRMSDFAPFVSPNSIFEIQDLVQQASIQLAQNGSAKLVFSDLAIRLTRLLHKK